MRILTLLISLLVMQSAQELYQRGLVQEHGAGNLEQAVVLYRQAALEAGRDRALAARALFRAGASLEKMGSPEAVEVYTEVTRTYPEQREQAQLAQSRLAAIRQRSSDSSAPAQGGGAPRTDVSALFQPLFAEYCISCHSYPRVVANLGVDGLDARDVSQYAPVWEKILKRLRARRDPPMGLPRPDERTYQAAVSTLELALDQAYSQNATLTTAERATDAELADRIAALLWGSRPDAPLLEAVQRGRLRDDAVLEQQVRRMIQDPRAIHLVDNFFIERWGRYGILTRIPADRFPADQTLLQSMAAETRLFLDSQLREDRSALELWTANYTFLNAQLARHYGIANITGDDFRRVTLPDNTRAGLLGQASFMGITWVLPTRTSPTKRGVHLLEQFFGLRPPDPPATVPPMAEGAAAQNRTMRERVADHKSNPACVSCHTHFDPLGFALENFDVVGRWRTTEGGNPIDASGAFPDGASFNGPAEFRSALLKYRDAFYASITERLFAYAVGRRNQGAQVHEYEMPAVRAIVRGAAPNDYRWSSIILGIVKSTPFQMKTLVP